MSVEQVSCAAKAPRSDSFSSWQPHYALPRPYVDGALFLVNAFVAAFVTASIIAFTTPCITENITLVFFLAYAFCGGVAGIFAGLITLSASVYAHRQTIRCEEEEMKAGTQDKTPA